MNGNVHYVMFSKKQPQRESQQIRLAPPVPAWSCLATDVLDQAQDLYVTLPWAPPTSCCFTKLHSSVGMSHYGHCCEVGEIDVRGY
jgi:hypothetical protein